MNYSHKKEKKKRDYSDGIEKKCDIYEYCI